MGISVQDAGIAVEKGRYYLVNLNADPSLNEMLVYYLKVTHTNILQSLPDILFLHHWKLLTEIYSSTNCLISLQSFFSKI